MNIKHAKDEVINGDLLEAIFARQKELWDKYHGIEMKSGVRATGDCPVNLDDKRGQSVIKDYAWRITEEVGEAIDAFEKDEKDHFMEELLDGLHFLTELTILVGKTPSDLIELLVKHTPVSLPLADSEEDKLSILFEYSGGVKKLQFMVHDLVRDLGMMCNTLKNKPWKQTHMKTDAGAFYHQLIKVWIDYINLLKPLGIELVANTYFKKSQVNKFRQRSKY